MRVKKIFVTLALLFVLFMNAMPVLAAEGELIDQETKDQIDAARADAGLMEGFLIDRTQDLFNIGGVSSIQNLVFGNPYSVWTTNTEEVHYGLFTETELKTFIKPLLAIFAGAYGTFVLLAIMTGSLKMGLRAYTPQARADFWTDVQMWVISAFFLGTFTLILEVMLGINQGITQTVKNVVENTMGVSVNGISIIAFASRDGLLVVADILGNLLVMLAEWVLALYLNFIYISRKVIIILLMIMAPVAAISLLYAKTRAFFGTWLKELAGNIFLQSIHAIVLATFAGMASLGAGIIFKLGLLIMFVPVTGIISKWLNLGDSSSTIGRVATMAGIGGIGGAIMLAKGAKGVMGSHRDNGGFRSVGDSSPASDGATSDITAAASGSGSSRWQKARTAAAITGGIVGAVAGLPLGGAGAAVGGAIGSKMGTTLLQGGRNIGAGSFNAMKTLTDPIMSQGDGSWKSVFSPGNWKSGFSQMWGNLAERRKWMGRMGESVGSTVGMGGIGQAMGHMLSGASQSRIMSEQFGNKTLADHAAENPGAPVEFRQTREDSAFYMQRGNEWQQISPYGAGDTKLAHGELRKVPYTLNDGTKWERQDSGTFTAPRLGGSTTVGGGGSMSIYGSNGQVLSTVPSASGSSGLAGSVGGSAGTANLGGGGSVVVNPSGASAASFGTGGGGGREIVGLSGSTPSLARKSGAYIEGADGKRYEDTRINPKDINPDEYFAHNVAGAPGRRQARDLGADILNGNRKQTPQLQTNFNTWQDNYFQQRNQAGNRHRGAF